MVGVTEVAAIDCWKRETSPVIGRHIIRLLKSPIVYTIGNGPSSLRRDPLWIRSFRFPKSRSPRGFNRGIDLRPTSLFPAGHLNRSPP